MKRLNDVRVLMYSHDTFGLGHLRRSRAVAHALVERYKGVTVLIVSGSQIAGAFDFRARVDFVKIPSVIKLYSGEYASMAEHIDLEDTLHMREGLVRQTAATFQPDFFIVDKEPLGLKGEVERTLRDCRRLGVPTVLGLRDVMDDPVALAHEWAARDLVSRIDALYDEVWVYGPHNFFDPLEGFTIPPGLAPRIRHTGFLRRDAPDPDERARGRILVTAGGGGDGWRVMNAVLDALDADPTLTAPFTLVPGPFMGTDEREAIHRRTANRGNVDVIDFDANLEGMVASCAGLVGMCGYNTFCEVLSFDRPALFMPRTHPRAEQLIRATRAAELGWSQVLDSDSAADPSRMAAALHVLAQGPRPSDASTAPDMSGLRTVCDRVAHLTGRTQLQAAE